MRVLHALEIILSEQREGNFEMHTGKIAQGLCIFVFYPEEGSTPHLLCCFLDFCRTQKAGPDKAETSVCERVTGLPSMLIEFCLMQDPVTKQQEVHCRNKTNRIWQQLVFFFFLFVQAACGKTSLFEDYHSYQNRAEQPSLQEHKCSKYDIWNTESESSSCLLHLLFLRNLL